MVQRLARRLDSLVIGWAIYACGTAMLVVHAMATNDGRALPAQALDAWTWLLVLYSGVLGTAITNVGWYYAIATVGMIWDYWLGHWEIVLQLINILSSLVDFEGDYPSTYQQWTDAALIP